MPEPVVITLIENNEETDTADEFEVDMSCYTSTCIFQKCNMYDRAHPAISQFSHFATKNV